MNWGKGIVLAFIFFAIVIGSMVVISMKQDVNLVAPDYYKQEIAYQDQIERTENFNKLTVKPVLKKETSSVLLVDFPDKLTSNFKSGELILFRPSTSKLDKKIVIELDKNGQLRIPIDKMKKGVWRIKISWKGSDSIEYYNESILHI